MSLTDLIYLDYQATTPLAPEARDAMLPYLHSHFWNPHSAHRGGRAAAAAVESARENVAALLPSGGRLIFTSGATEAINLAIKGSGRSIAAAATDHAAVLDCVEYLGGSVMSVDGEGLLKFLPDTGRWRAEGVTQEALNIAQHLASRPLHHPAGGPPPRVGEGISLRHAGQQ